MRAGPGLAACGRVWRSPISQLAAVKMVGRRSVMDLRLLPRFGVATTEAGIVVGGGVFRGAG